jgi:hypothetical protein
MNINYKEASKFSISTNQTKVDLQSFLIRVGRHRKKYVTIQYDSTFCSLFNQLKANKLN